MNMFSDSPLTTRAYFAPKLKPISEIEVKLNQDADVLEERLDFLRKNQGSFHGNNCPPEYNEIREIRKKLCKIEAELIKIRNQNNPEFVVYWKLEN